MANADGRRSARAKVILTAVIENGLSRIPVRVSNLSVHGALVIGNGIASDERVIFHCNGFAIRSYVAWASAGHAGIQFDNPIETQMLVRKERVPGAPITKDTRQLDFRRPGFRGNQMTDEERKIVEEWGGTGPKSPEDQGP